METVDTSGKSYKNPPNTFPANNCTWFAFGRVKELTTVSITYKGNAGTWYDSAPSNKKFPPGSPPNGVSIVCWSGGSGGYGHVGVVEEHDDTTGAMVFSDCNRVGVGVTERIINSSEYKIRKLMGSTYKFLGYLKP